MILNHTCPEGFVFYFKFSNVIKFWTFESLSRGGFHCVQNNVYSIMILHLLKLGKETGHSGRVWTKKSWKMNALYRTRVD